jgi:Protein of unknown function (DUF1353)
MSTIALICLILEGSAAAKSSGQGKSLGGVGVLKVILLVWGILMCEGLPCNYAFAGGSRIDRFVGTLVLVDFGDPNFRNFKLGEDLKYIDPKGREWFAWRDLVTDGASIPQFLWSVVGSPYTGNYRRAAIMHDFYCSHIYREWQGVSNMFYDAMLTDGVSKLKALLMYYAVVRFGPKWTLEEIQTCPPDKNCAKPGDLNINRATPSIKSNQEDIYRNEIRFIGRDIENKGLDKQRLKQIASNKPSLDYTYSTERVSDNWIEFRWRHQQ